MIRAALVYSALGLLILMSAPSHAAIQAFELHIRDHLFYPASIRVPANQKVKLIIHNHDDTPEEFDSFSLNREKVIFAGRKVTIYIGPLKAGEYPFMGEFNPNTAQGVVIATRQQENGNVN
ncbi:cupredoxin domain-containing protein [Neptunicella sp. SCSIO 80796]|uniref:cupredoxin domain-containing protein n=1 Tax=Neptunicella plasticusilytica TaxID=3117012 RepID=UPI003A4D705E